ncbi:Membrane protein involved in the export of O-antigen and teichoic acid [Rhodospirillales bacterium URHD0017]|nr:Membrane protein involved in the export of O-antigen and teichoic acid [Rhodospirillales bacterium URHD0017]
MSSSIRRSIAFSVADRYASIAIGFVTTIILSRLLTPKDFGIFSIAMSFVVLADIFRDFGTGNYLVQVKQLTDQQLRTAFTTFLATSALGGLVLLLGAPVLVAFYGDALFWQLMPIFAFNLMLGPFSVPGMSLLRRNLGFDTLAGINLLGIAVNFVVVVVLAWRGHGVMSLAWATLAASVVRVGTVWIVHPCFTAFRISLRGWKAPFEFGIVSTATSILNVSCEYLPQLIIGRSLGLAAAGLFGRATSVCQLPDRLVIGALSPVLLPALSRQTQAGVHLKPAYLVALSHMSALQWPILLCLALLAEPAVLILYGDQWKEVAPLVRIMALAALVMFPAFMTYPTVVALGGVRDMLWMSLLSQPLSVFLIFLASPFGLEAIAATQVISAPVHIFIAIKFIGRRIGVSWAEIARAVGRSAVVALCSAAVPALVVVLQGGFSFGMSYTTLAYVLAGAAAGWLVGLILSGHPLLDELANGMKLVSRRLRRSAF